MTTQTLESCIRDKIRKSRRMVFLRDDFAALGGYDQVGRVLRQLEAQGQLVRIGKGLPESTRCRFSAQTAASLKRRQPYRLDDKRPQTPHKRRKPEAISTTTSPVKTSHRAAQAA